MIFDYHLKQAENNNDTGTWKQKIGNDIRERQEKAWNYWKDQYSYFLPTPEFLGDLLKYSWLLKICFTLKKPFISKDENELHPYDTYDTKDNREIQNP